MDEERRVRDAERWDKVFTKLDALAIKQTEQGKDIEHINKCLFTNNGETCIVTDLKNLTKSVDELKTKRLINVSTAQAIWTIFFGLLSVGSTVTAILLTVKQLTGK